MTTSLKMLILFLSSLCIMSVQISAEVDECEVVSRCGEEGPEIRFPFMLEGRQPEYCRYPAGFELYCTEKNETMLNLSHSAKLLLVKKINYKSQEVHVHDPDDCRLTEFLKLNLSNSPFNIREENKEDYSLFKCSSTTANSSLLYPVPCFSIPGNYTIYAADSRLGIYYFDQPSCHKIHDVSLPRSLPEKENVFPLNWDKPMCGSCEVKGGKCRLKKDNRTEPATFCAKGASKGVVVVGATLGSIFLVFALFVVSRVYGFNRLERENQKRIEKFLEDYINLKPSRYSYADIKKITDQFKVKLGEGGYGTVYKGKLSDQVFVAVKILNNISEGNGEEFINEVGTMGRIHHVNIIRLVGFCADGFRRALVYEFLPNKSLEKFIFPATVTNYSLGWKKLQDIALGIAKGLEYLHQGCDQRILHFDIKPHNILLDHNFNPKISDFGLAKLCSKDQSAISMSLARGTTGYIAPEMLSTNFGNVSYKSDVYSFGMLLLEIVGGRKNIDVTVQNTSQLYFPEWIYNHLDQGDELLIRIEQEQDGEIAKRLAVVGLWCIQCHPMDRPSMKLVVQMLEGKEDKLTMPPNPFNSTGAKGTTGGAGKRSLQQKLSVIQETE